LLLLYILVGDGSSRGSLFVVVVVVDEFGLEDVYCSFYFLGSIIVVITGVLNSATRTINFD